MTTFLLVIGAIYALSLIVILYDQLEQWGYPKRDAALTSLAVILFAPVFIFIWLVEAAYHLFSRIMERIFK